MQKCFAIGQELDILGQKKSRGFWPNPPPLDRLRVNLKYAYPIKIH